MRCRRIPCRQRGAALAEFALAAVPLLFLGFLSVEAARWHATRQMLYVALLDAARAGATSHARPDVIERRFEHALLPLFHPAGAHGGAAARMRAAFADITRQAGVLPWRIDVLSPSPAAFADFADSGLRVPGASALRAIRNDYQAEQHARRRGQGWTDGRGPRSRQTIFDANTLRLRLHYVHPPLMPGMRALLRAIGTQRQTSGQGPEAHRNAAAARAGMLVVAMELSLPMQSHPVQWRATATARHQPPPKSGTAQPNGRIRDGARLPHWADEAGDAAGPFWIPGHAANRPLRETAAQSGRPSLAKRNGAIATLAPREPALADAQAADSSGMTDQDAEACGVILCCQDKSTG
ncbi:TadE/TadG family type IV pilus assembly protein [Bordetella genomosp. 9]|uniref:Pilus assembly protein TadE n=1 Tax=Bordetella genomosp. 9 TaxID=1416803 RepID=A0A1W6Z216_9BORD|nr:TadE/TadG family type IV pilus assembly protein [Bordetella genomosp. 9]ARP87291.1 hypothetical protein CAL13_14565 [Bordetella genomosp. 9]